jgi:hypothetical protein
MTRLRMWRLGVLLGGWGGVGCNVECNTCIQPDHFMGGMFTIETPEGMRAALALTLLGSLALVGADVYVTHPFRPFPFTLY